MKLGKKLSIALATIITSSSILLASATTVQAKASSIVVTTTSGSYYEYSYADLKASAVSSFLGDSVNGALYQHFLQSKASINSYYDDVRNVYVPSSAIYQEATNCILTNKAFDFKSYMENTSTSTTNITSKKVQNSSGTILVDGVPISTDSSDFDVVSVE